MPITNASTLLAYADVQMAAEAIDPDKVLLGERTLAQVLISGNNRSSKFTTTQAAVFVEDWEVEPNTATGFSGTLFKFIGTSDPARGLTQGDLVLSFRSTEFADDAARDNEATNAMEIRDRGWAFGQIDDMRLHRSERTVRNQLTAIYRKLGAGNRAEAGGALLDAPGGADGVGGEVQIGTFVLLP